MRSPRAPSTRFQPACAAGWRAREGSWVLSRTTIAIWGFRALGVQGTRTGCREVASRLCARRCALAVRPRSLQRALAVPARMPGLASPPTHGRDAAAGGRRKTRLELSTVSPAARRCAPRNAGAGVACCDVVSPTRRRPHRNPSASAVGRWPVAGVDKRRRLNCPSPNGVWSSLRRLSTAAARPRRRRRRPARAAGPARAEPPATPP